MNFAVGNINRRERALNLSFLQVHEYKVRCQSKGIYVNKTTLALSDRPIPDVMLFCSPGKNGQRAQEVFILVHRLRM